MEIIKKDKPDSIKVSQNAKGDYAFEVKTYCEIEDYKKVINRLVRIFNMLHTKFRR